MLCGRGYEDLDEWKRWLDTGNETELMNGLEVIERTIALTKNDVSGGTVAFTRSVVCCRVQ